MVRFFPGDFWVRNRKVYVAILAFAWLLGIISGGYWAVGAGESFRKLLMIAPFSPASLAGLSCSAVLVVLISGFAILMNQPWMILLLAFFKGICLGILGIGAALSFSPGGWLISFLFVFSDVCSLPMIFWFWIHPFSSGRNVYAAAASVLIAVLAVHGFNVRYVSHFLVDLLMI